MLSFFGIGGIIAPALTGRLTEVIGHFNVGIYLMVGFILAAGIRYWLFSKKERGISK